MTSIDHPKCGLKAASIDSLECDWREARVSLVLIVQSEARVLLE